jgi:hypothetical protein
MPEWGISSTGRFAVWMGWPSTAVRSIPSHFAPGILKNDALTKSHELSTIAWGPYNAKSAVQDPQPLADAMLWRTSSEIAPFCAEMRAE